MTAIKAPARCVYHAVPRDTPRRSQQLRQLIRSLTYRFRHWYRHHSSAVYCHPGPRCRHRRPRLNGSHVLSIFSEPTAWLTARRNCSRVYAWLSNLCKHIFMLPISLCVCRLSSWRVWWLDRQTADIWHTVDGYMLWMSKKCKQIRRTRNFDPQTKAGAWKLSTALFVLDGSSRMDSLDGPIVDLLSHCLSTALMCLAVCCSVATLTGRLACELRLATSRHESHDSHISSGTSEYFLLMAFHTLSLLHFRLLHFPPLRYAPAFSTPALSASPSKSLCSIVVHNTSTNSSGNLISLLSSSQIIIAQTNNANALKYINSKWHNLPWAAAAVSQACHTAMHIVLPELCQRLYLFISVNIFFKN